MTTSSLTSGWTNRPVYSRATTLGLVVYLLILLIFAALITITIDPADALFVVIFAVPSIVIIGLSPNPPKDTDGRREDSGRGWVRELQGRWPGVLG